MNIKINKYLISSIVILLIFFIVKSVFIFHFHGQGKYISSTNNIAGDAVHYLEIGENLHLYNAFSDDYSGLPTEKATWRPPIWPFILSLFYKLSNNFLVFILLKTVLVTGLLLLSLYYFEKHFRKSSLFVLFPILIIFEPQFLFYSLTFLTEDLTAVLVLVYFLFYLKFIPKKLNSLIFGALSALLLLTHPITIFLITSVIAILFIKHFKSNKISLSLIVVSFVLFSLIWPVRNHLTFNKGPYLTTSQGIALAKSWNDKIVTDFNNVDGDMADPRINLEFIDYKGYKIYEGNIEESNLYKQATINFIKTKSLSDLISISLKKIKSNFNPLPEKKQEMFLNKLSIPFRVLYLFLFLQSIYLFFFKRKVLNEIKLNSIYFVLAIIIAQLVTSVFLYTSLRFNVIFSLTLALIFLIINSENIKRLLLKFKFQR